MAAASGLVTSSPGKYELWVEGSDDRSVMVALLDHLGAPKRRIEVRPVGGIDKVLAALRVELMFGTGVERLGVVVDADTDIQQCWSRIRPIITGAGYASIPQKPKRGGLIASHVELPQLGVWIMPDNAASGAVEEFARLLVPSGDRLWPLAERTIQQVIATDKRFGDTHPMKATVHTWLAWQEEPGRPMGQAITKRFLDPTSPNADALYNWVRTLFSL